MGNILKEKYYEEIKERIADLKRDDLPLWGKMNVGEMLCHLADQIKVATGEIICQERSTFMTKVVLKNLILMGMKAPKGKVQTMPEVNPHLMGSKPVSFDADRDYLLRKISDFREADQNKMHAHPAFGKLTKNQWGKLIYTHLDHHLSQFGS